jgi:hypothetical protein
MKMNKPRTQSALMWGIGLLALLSVAVWVPEPHAEDPPTVVSDSTPLPALPAGWIIFKSDEGRFQVYMPNEPELTTGKRSTVVGSLDENHYEASLGDAFYLVEVRDLPRIASWLMSDEGLLDSSAESLIEFAKADNIKRQRITMAGSPGLDLVFAAKSHKGFIERARILLVQRRLFVVIAGAPSTEPKNYRNEFIESFRFSEK